MSENNGGIWMRNDHFSDKHDGNLLRNGWFYTIV